MRRGCPRGRRARGLHASPSTFPGGSRATPHPSLWGIASKLHPEKASSETVFPEIEALLTALDSPAQGVMCGKAYDDYLVHLRGDCSSG